MSENSNLFEDPLPSGMSRDAFIDRFGGVYEHSVWIAAAVFDSGLTKIHNTRDGLSAAMESVLEAADETAHLKLIRAHPDLAGKAALAGKLTADSTSEQAGAGLDQCSTEELAEFTRLNSAYTEKFSFPFIIAVKGLNRHDILAAFRTRLTNNADQERATALKQINKIARLRLDAL